MTQARETAELMIAASESSSDLYYASRFLAPDPFVYVRVDGRRVLLMSDLELDRAKTQARVDEVLSLTEWLNRAKAGGAERPGLVDAVDAYLSTKGVRNIIIPSHMGVGFAEGLRGKGYGLNVRQDPFYPERMVKSEEEVKKIREAQRYTEEAFQKALDAIAESKVEKGKLIWKGEGLTSERIKKIINVSLMEHECVAQHTIVACGVQGCDPHNTGSGPLFVNQPIIMDIFPRSSLSLYFADMTRTVVKGKATPKIKKMYQAVQEGQEIAFQAIRDGVEASGIHKAIQESFKAQGFETGMEGGRMQGFFHGTGHGVGLDIHEPPRISAQPAALHEGMVVTVEPGLYYLDAGGVRIEDMVVVRKSGCENLTRAPKVLEI